VPVRAVVKTDPVLRCLTRPDSRTTVADALERGEQVIHGSWLDLNRHGQVQLLGCDISRQGATDHGRLEHSHEPAEVSLALGIAPGRGSPNHTHKYVRPPTPPPRRSGVHAIHDLHEFTHLQPLSAKPGREGADVIVGQSANVAWPVNAHEVSHSEWPVRSAAAARRMDARRHEIDS